MHTYVHKFYWSIFQILDIFDVLYKIFGQVNISCEPEAIWHNYFNPLMSFISISLPLFLVFGMKQRPMMIMHYIPHDCDQDILKLCDVQGPLVADWV